MRTCNLRCVHCYSQSRDLDYDGELNHEEGVRLADLDIRTVVNFLIEEETAAKGRDRLPAGVREVAQPISAGGGLVEVVNEARRTADFSVITPDLNPEFHRLLVDEAREQYAALFREIADPVFQGVDWLAIRPRIKTAPRIVRPGPVD